MVSDYDANKNPHKSLVQAHLLMIKLGHDIQGELICGKKITSQDVV